MMFIKLREMIIKALINELEYLDSLEDRFAIKKKINRAECIEQMFNDILED